MVWHRYSGRASRGRVPLYAPVGAERRLALAYDLDGDGLTDVFDFVPVGPGAFDVGPFEVELARTAHPVECYAIRLTAEGRSLVYTGDTGPCARRHRAGPRRRRPARRGGAPARARAAAGAAPHRPRGGRARRGGRGGPAAAHPHPGVGRRDRPAVRGQRGVLRDRAGPPGAIVRDLRTAMVDDERDGVRLTSLDQPLGDGLEVTKGDLVDYLDAVADRLVPLLAGRPLSVQAGAAGPGALHAAQRLQGRARLGAHRRRCGPRARTARSHQVLCDDRRTLLWLANQRAVEFHVPFFRAGESEPTGLVLDLDPPEGAGFAVVVAVARLVRQALDGRRAGGGGEDQRVEGAARRRPGARARVRGRRRRDPRAGRPHRAARPGAGDDRLHQGGPAAAGCSSTPPASGQGTIVAAYSPRVRPGLPVSVPVGWDALDDVQPGDFTVTTRRDCSATATRGPSCCRSRRSCPPTWSRRGTPSRSRGCRRCTRASGARRRSGTPRRRPWAGHQGRGGAVMTERGSVTFETTVTATGNNTGIVVPERGHGAAGGGQAATRGGHRERLRLPQHRRRRWAAGT